MVVVIGTDWSLEVRGVTGVNLLPRCEVDQGNGDGVTGYQRVARRERR